MTDLIRVINIPWLLVLGLFWSIRFKEPSTDRTNSATQSRSRGWYWNHIAELLGTGYLLGFGFGYFAKTGDWMGWAGEDDLRLPGWCWVIGLGFGLFNLGVQRFSRDGRASKLAMTAAVSAAVFFNLTAILHWRDQGYRLIDARVFIALIAVGAIIIAVVVTTITEKYLTGDFAISLSLPFCFLFLIYGVDAYPVPDRTEFMVAILVGTGLIPIRVLLMHWLIKPEQRWCIKSNMDPKHQLHALEQRLDELSKPKTKTKKSLSETFNESYDDAYTAAKLRQARENGTKHFFTSWEEEEEEEEEDGYSEGGESLHWDQVKVIDPFDE